MAEKQGISVKAGVAAYLDAKYGTLRPASWAKHRMTLNKFAVAFASRELDELTKKELREWRDSLGIQPSSANKYMDRVKALYTFLVNEELVTRNPAAGIERLDEPATRRVRLPVQSLGDMLASARHPRDAAFVAVSIELLLRGGEVAELRVGDLMGDTLRVMVEKQKGELTEDEMAISPQLERRLHDWLGIYRRAAGPVDDSAYLFPRIVYRRSGSSGDYSLRPHEKISKPEEVIKLALARAGYEVPKGAGVHAIRRTCARLLFDHLVTEENGDRAMSHVSSLMHHSSRRTTELYLGVTGDRALRNKIVRNGGATPLSLATATVDEAHSQPSATARVYSLSNHRV